MARKVGGIGILLLLVVAAIVLFLVARTWQTMAPTAEQIRVLTETPTAGSQGSDGASPAVRTERPGLEEMRESTSGHSDAVQEALSAIE